MINMSLRNGFIRNPSEGNENREYAMTYRLITGQDMVVSARGNMIGEMNAIRWRTRVRDNKGILYMYVVTFHDGKKLDLSNTPLFVCTSVDVTDVSFYMVFELKDMVLHSGMYSVETLQNREVMAYEYNGVPERITPSLRLLRSAISERRFLFGFLRDQGISDIDEETTYNLSKPNLINSTTVPCVLDYLLKKYGHEEILDSL